MVKFDLFFSNGQSIITTAEVIKHTVRFENYLPVGRRHLNSESGGKRSVEIKHVIIQVPGIP